MERIKAKIITIGSFDSNGMPTNWGFDCNNGAKGIEYLESGEVF